MIKIGKTGKVYDILEMRGTLEELTAETVLIMRTLARRLEAQTGIPADYHIVAMAHTATDDRLVGVFDKFMEEQLGVDPGPRSGNEGMVMNLDRLISWLETKTETARAASFDAAADNRTGSCMYYNGRQSAYKDIADYLALMQQNGFDLVQTDTDPAKGPAAI